jgi:CO/xanthine dehydrogenase FAD-binding subunit
MNPTRYVRPKDLLEALAVLEASTPNARIIAGATDLLPMMRKTRYDSGSGDDATMSILVDVGSLDELVGIREDDGYLHIGGAATMAAIEASPFISERVPVLAEAARSVGSPLVRNRATVGGNLATASPSADTAPALLALDAAVTIAGARGERQVAIADFFRGYRTTALETAEVITDIVIPVPPPTAAGAFQKVGLRNADAISVVCVATVLDMDGDTCRGARVALGAVAPVPLRAAAVEEALQGTRLTAVTARAAAKRVHEHISPIDDVRASAEYRLWVAESVAARTILQAAGIEDD